VCNRFRHAIFGKPIDTNLHAYYGMYTGIVRVCSRQSVILNVIIIIRTFFYCSSAKIRPN